MIVLIGIVSFRHALYTPPFIEPLPKRMIKILTTSIRVDDQTQLLLEGLIKGLHNQAFRSDFYGLYKG